MFSLFGNKDSSSQPKPASVPESGGWFTRLKQGLARTGAQFKSGLGSLWSRGKIDEALYEDLETLLIGADVGLPATQRILAELREAVRAKRIADPALLEDELKSILRNLLAPLQQPLDVSTAKPFVIMIAGVNGAGKTTTIGKLAKYFQSEGKSVMLAAGDTFRAAAREQLMTWGERNGVTVIAQEGGDAAAVIFDAIQSAKARGIDVVLADTAGRLPTQLHLMDEIRKVKRVIAKADATAPHETLLVLDANTGQNALAQVKAFDDALQLTGLVVTKLDGTARGGSVAALAAAPRSLAGAAPVPVRFIGVGEGIDDLRPFDAQQFVDALFA